MSRLRFLLHSTQPALPGLAAQPAGVAEAPPCSPGCLAHPPEPAAAPTETLTISAITARLDALYKDLHFAYTAGFLHDADALTDDDVWALREAYREMGGQPEQFVALCRQASRYPRSDPRRGHDVAAAVMRFKYRRWCARLKRDGKNPHWHLCRLEILLARHDDQEVSA